MCNDPATPSHSPSLTPPTCAKQSLSLPGVAGLHVMPLTKGARQMTMDFLADGTLPSVLSADGILSAGRVE